MGPCVVPKCVSDALRFENAASDNTASAGGAPAARMTTRKGVYIDVTCAVMLAKP